MVRAQCERTVINKRSKKQAEQKTSGAKNKRSKKQAEQKTSGAKKQAKQEQAKQNQAKHKTSGVTTGSHHQKKQEADLHVPKKEMKPAEC
jgi:hypothetical protein